MDSSEETSPLETTGRRTRSGRCSLPLASKPAGRKTRKKMVLVEVEVSDEEDGEVAAVKESNSDEKQSKPSGKGKRSKDPVITEEKARPDETTQAPPDAVLDNERVEEKDAVESEMVPKECEKVPTECEIVLKESEIVPKESEIVPEESEPATTDVQLESAEKDENGIEDDHTMNNAEDDELQEQSKNQHEEQMEVDEDNAPSEKINSDVACDCLEVVNKENEQDMVVESEDVCMQESDAEEAAAKEEEIEEGEVVTKTEEEVQEKIEVPETNKLDPADSKQILPADPDAENISEDELPTVQVAKVPETEEVSDEELPGPKRAELPADTEVVSEDELPAVKKEGTKRKIVEGDYDPGSPTSENEVSPKKPFLELEVEKEKEKPEKPKKLPELDKYWKAVNDDPTDFTGWTYLLQYVDQENDMEAAREAYDAFLSHYPYCYGYWRKYADYEKRKGNKKKCEEVFERGLKAIPLSVDLWIHYLTYVRTSKPDDEDFIRSQFERALGACGLEFRSDRLWDSHMKWETDGKRLQHVTAIYDKLLTTPTQGYTSHFDNFQEHVTNNPPNKILEVDEFLALRKEVKHMLKHDVTTEPADNPDVPPGEDREEISTDEETKAIRERIISIRRKIHKNTVTAVTGRWNFEEGIKRPYFHVKPLERCQLKNWQEYLDYEIAQGDQTRIIVLFERCLIACALYEEFWLRFVHYLEGLKDTELHSKIKDVYERACTIHHIKKPNLHLQWAMFEESIKNYTKAAEILVNLEKSVPNILQVAYRRINLERRRDDFEKCSQLYEHYINNAKNKSVSTNLAIKYARFTLKIMKNSEQAVEILNSALAKDGTNPRLYLQLIDLSMQKDEVKEDEVIGYLDSFLEKDNVDLDQKVLFAQRKLEYLEDFGSNIRAVQKAYEEYQKCVKASKEMKKKEPAKGDATSIAKKDKNLPLPSSQTNSYANYGNYGNSSGTAGAYQYSGSQQGQYNYSQYGQNEQYQYGNWQYPQSGYSGYNQWSGYSGGYGY